MNKKIRFWAYISLILVFYACADSTVFYFHEEDPEEAKQRMSEIVYADNVPWTYGVASQMFAYDHIGRIKTIKLPKLDMTSSINYFEDSIVVKTSTLDTSGIQEEKYKLILDSSNRILHGVRTTAMYAGGVKDSINLEYDMNGYLVHFDYYEGQKMGHYDLKYCIRYFIENGNVARVRMLNTDVYTYTYDTHPHIDAIEFCTEMPKAVHRYSEEYKLPLLLPALYNYMGTKSKNNVIGLEINYNEKIADKKNVSINYNYLYSASGRLHQVVMSGVLDKGVTFSKTPITFKYASPSNLQSAY